MKLGCPRIHPDGTLPLSFTRRICSASKSRRTCGALLSTAVVDYTPGSPAIIPRDFSAIPVNNSRPSTSLPDAPIRVSYRKRPRATHSCWRGDLSTTDCQDYPSSVSIPPAVNRNVGGGEHWGPREGGPASVETGWACLGSGSSTSTSSYHNGFADLFAMPATGQLEFGIPYRLRPGTTKSSRSTEVSQVVCFSYIRRPTR